MQDFQGNLEIGSIGEQFIVKRIRTLFPHLWIIKIKETSQIFNNEGCDIHIDAAVYESNRPDNCSPIQNYEQHTEEQTTQDQTPQEGAAPWPPEGCPEGEEQRLVKVSGFIEVKTIQINQYLTRNDNEEILHGTIAFEIWKNTNRSSHGSLLQMFYPEEHDRVAAQPMSFAYVLLDSNERVYACIIFERFNAFKERLIKLAGREGLDLAHPDRIPMNDRTWCPLGCRLKQNTWHVALDEISDLMTVFMVGDDPAVIDDNCCSHDIIRARLEKLKALSDGRHIPNEGADGPTPSHTIDEILRRWQQSAVPDELVLQEKPRRNP